MVKKRKGYSWKVQQRKLSLQIFTKQTPAVSTVTFPLSKSRVPVTLHRTATCCSIWTFFLTFQAQ